MKHLGDYDAGSLIYDKFTTYQPSTGAAFALAGTPALSVYKDGSTTQDQDGLTLTASFDSVTGLNHWTLDTSADPTFYSDGSNFQVVITAGTVDGASVVGTVVASFSLRKGSALKPTNAGRTLDVSATGEAGIDLANIGLPVGPVPAFGILDNGTAQAATSTTIQLRAAASFADDAIVGAIVMALGSTQGYWQVRTITDYVSATDTATVDAWTVTPSGTVTYIVLAAPPALAALPAVNVTQFGGVAGTFSGGRPEVNASHAAGTAWNSGAIGAATLAADTLTAAKVAADVGTEIAAAVWAAAARTLTALDEDSTTLDLDATIRAALGLASANLDTQIATLATGANLATVAGYLDTEIAAILADTNELQTDWANGGRLDLILDARASQASVDDLPTNAELATALGTADDAVLAAVAVVDTVVDAIKVTTDKLDDTLEDSGGGAWIFTVAALANGPSGSGSSPAVIADAVWDELLSGHATAGSAGAALSTAAAASGMDAAGIRAAVGLAAANLDTQLSGIDAKTTNLPTDPADQSLIIAATDAVMNRLGAPAGASVSADVAAVKAQTAAIEADTQDLQARTPAALVGGRVDASVGAMAANVMTAAAAAADLTAELQAGLATAAAVAAVATQVDDVPTNAELATALAAADDAVLAQVALVKTRTDLIPADPADASDIAASFVTVNATLATIAGYLDTEIAAIKAKTDALPVDPAVQSTLAAAIAAVQTAANAIKAKTDVLTFTSTRLHADTKAVAGVVLQENGTGTQSIGGP